MNLPTFHSALNVLSHLHGLALWLSGTVWGAVVGLFYFLFVPEGDVVRWYNSPTFAAAVAAGGFTVIIALINWFRDWIKDKRDEEGEDGRQRIDLAKLTNEQFVALMLQKDVWAKQKLDDLEDRHRREIEFLRLELIQKEVGEFRAREYAHGAFNALNKSYGHIRKLEALLPHQAPPFTFVYQDDIWEMIKPKVEEFAKQLRDNVRAVSGAPDKSETPDA